MKKTQNKIRTPHSNTGVTAYNEKSSKALCNACLDWFSVVLKKHTLNDVKKFFGNEFALLDYAINHYDYTLIFHEKIKVLVSGREDMNICIVLSGSACRELEKHYSWEKLFRFIKLYQTHSKTGEYIPNYNVTRIDYSYDFYNWEFELTDKIEKYYLNNCYTSYFREITRMDKKSNKGILKGKSIRWGRKSSDFTVLFYNKLLERNCSDHIIDSSVKSWHRMECSFNHTMGMILFDWLVTPTIDVSKEVSQYIYKYIDFKVKCKGYTKESKNLNKVQTCRWWLNTLDTTIKSDLTKVAYQSSIDKKRNYVEHSVIKTLSLVLVSDKLTNGKRKKKSLLKSLIEKNVNRVNQLDLQMVNEFLIKEKQEPITLDVLKQLIKNLV